VFQNPVISSIATTSAMIDRTIKPHFIQGGSSSSPSLWKEPKRIIRTTIITRETARKGISSTIMPTAYLNEIASRPIINATIASICFLPSPKIFAFCRTAKTIVKISKNGRIVVTNRGLDKIVAPPYSNAMF